jgi:hypothetical protein
MASDWFYQLLVPRPSQREMNARRISSGKMKYLVDPSQIQMTVGIVSGENEVFFQEVPIFVLRLGAKFVGYTSTLEDNVEGAA